MKGVFSGILSIGLPSVTITPGLGKLMSYANDIYFEAVYKYERQMLVLPRVRNLATCQLRHD